MTARRAWRRALCAALVAATMLLATNCTSSAPPDSVAATSLPSPTPTPSVVSEQTSPPPELYLVDTYDPRRSPDADLDAAFATVAGSGRSVIAVIGGDWCPDCWNLDAFFDDHPATRDAFARHYAMVKINYSEANWNEDFLLRHPPFDWVPHFVIFDADGNRVRSYDTRGLMANGRFDEAAFAEFLAAAG